MFNQPIANICQVVRLFLNIFRILSIPAERSENQRFYDVFRVYRKRPMSCNGLKTLQKIITGKYFLTVNYKEPDNNLLILVKVNIKGTSMTLFEVKLVNYMHHLVTLNNSQGGQCFSC